MFAMLAILRFPFRNAHSTVFTGSLRNDFRREISVQTWPTLLIHVINVLWIHHHHHRRPNDWRTDDENDVHNHVIKNLKENMVLRPRIPNYVEHVVCQYDREAFRSHYRYVCGYNGLFI